MQPDSSSPISPPSPIALGSSEDPKASSKTKMKFEDIVVNHLGEFGRYQRIQFLLVCLPAAFTAMHALSWTFTAAPSLHRCLLPGEEAADASYWLPKPDARLSLKTCDAAAHKNWPYCSYTQCELANGSRCGRGYVYDRSEIAYSALQRWDIVCEWGVLKAVVQSSYYVGQMAGSLVFGYLGDKIGRKKVFFIAIILQIVAGLALIVVPHWTLFAFLRAAVGFAHPGIFVVAVVIGMELVGPSKRKIASVFTGAFFALGQVALGLLAYSIRDYRLLQLSIAAPALIFLSYWWLIPESSRWLVSQRRYADADAVLQRAARINKTNLPEKWWEMIDDETTHHTGGDDKLGKARITSYGFGDLLRTPRIRKIMLTMLFVWPVVSMVYYGISMNTSFLGGDIYTTFIFGALMEIPAIFCVFALIDKLGRKALLAGGLTITSLCLISNLFIDEKHHWLITLTQFLIAKGSVTGVYATIYTYTPELFPTVVRGTAMGACSMLARVGAIAASYIAMWLVEYYGKISMIVPFASLGLIAAALVTFLLPETANKPLAETIEEIEGHVQNVELQPLNAPAISAASSLKSRDKTH